MEIVVNSIIGLLVLIFDVLRAVLGWGDKALLVALGAGAGAYLGVRAALVRHDEPAGWRHR
jgi:uncharacterized membrane protein YfcA